MLAFLRHKASDRKFRLFAIACWRRILDLIPDVRSRVVIEIAEGLIGGKFNERELVLARFNAQDVFDPNVKGVNFVQEINGEIRDAAMAAHCLSLYDFVSLDGEPCSQSGLNVAYGTADLAAKAASRSRTFSVERQAQSQLIRDIPGNPFRPATLDHRWQSTSVRDLALSIYDNRSFDQMPILADALEDSGCNNREIIQHCRGDGPHVKGCWVVELILGKE